MKEAGFLWLFGGQVNKNVRTVTVNGKESFKSDEEVYLDAEIVLLVNTYNGDSYQASQIFAFLRRRFFHDQTVMIHVLEQEGLLRHHILLSCNICPPIY